MLEGAGGDWLTVAKVAAILRRCLGALPDLADAPLSVESAHANHGLSRYSPGEMARRGDRVVVPLLSGGAQCEPAVDMGTFTAVGEAGCCGPATARTAQAGCCG